MRFLKVLKGIHDKCVLYQPKNALQRNVGVAKRCETEEKSLRVRPQDKWDVRRRCKYKKYALHHKKKRVRNKYMNRLKREFPDTWLEFKERTKPRCMNTQI